MNKKSKNNSHLLIIKQTNKKNRNLLCPFSSFSTQNYICTWKMCTCSMLKKHIWISWPWVNMHFVYIYLFICSFFSVSFSVMFFCFINLIFLFLLSVSCHFVSLSLFHHHRVFIFSFFVHILSEFKTHVNVMYCSHVIENYRSHFKEMLWFYLFIMCIGLFFYYYFR